MAGGKVIRLAEQEAYAPERHTHTDAWRIISKETVGAEIIKFGLAEIRPGGEAQEDIHSGADQGFFILSGIGEGFVDDMKFVIHPNECVWIPAGAKHGIKPKGRQTLRFIVFTTVSPSKK